MGEAPGAQQQETLSLMRRWVWGAGPAPRGPVLQASETRAHPGDERVLQGFQQKLDVTGDSNQSRYWI